MPACFRVQRALTPLNWLTGTMTTSILLDAVEKRLKYRVKVVQEPTCLFCFLPPSPAKQEACLECRMSRQRPRWSVGVVDAYIRHSAKRMICIEPFERFVYIGRVEGDSAGPDAYISGAQRRVVAKEEGKHALPSRAERGACCMCRSIRTHV